MVLEIVVVMAVQVLHLQLVGLLLHTLEAEVVLVNQTL
jgi:hypothetical protein